jgi:CRISPR system Cascade subunit CasC
MLIELHTLTAHAPSNLNRDDFGRPKTAYFGGVERARISSQALKRAIRTSDYLAQTLGSKLSTRSRDIPKLIYDELKPRFEDRLDRLQTACEAVTHTLGKPDTKRSGDEGDLYLSQIVFVTPDEMGRLKKVVTGLVASNDKLSKPKTLSNTLAKDAGLDTKPRDAVDMALFGRMTTDDANEFAHVEAAMQVAHPISTHAVVGETDYFTAVDDRSANDQRGSAHLNELDFNSAVYYKYFSCDLERLSENLNSHDEAITALVAFLDAACRIAPSGKQNSFASHSLASAALLVAREANVPCSLAEAFERPVAPSEDGFLARSLQRMTDHYAALVRDFDLPDAATLYHRIDTGGRSLPDDAPFARAERLSGLWSFLRERAQGEPA